MTPLRSTPLARGEPLQRSTGLPPRTKAIPKRSPERVRDDVKRRAFVKRFLREHPCCQIQWHPDCTKRSVECHEALRQGRGGARIPGPTAARQGQRFWAVCRLCHDALTNPPSALFQALAIEEGWIINYPENLK